jgi:Snf7
MNLFGIKKKAPAPVQSSSSTAADTILLLRRNVEMLDKRESHILLKINTALNEAKEKAAKKDKKGAIFCLKRKKMYENEIEKLQGELLIECSGIAGGLASTGLSNDLLAVLLLLVYSSCKSQYLEISYVFITSHSTILCDYILMIYLHSI